MSNKKQRTFPSWFKTSLFGMDQDAIEASKTSP
jgi:hypothetical protein